MNNNTVLVHRQQSRLDPSVEIGVFLTRRSRNSKTGSMPQACIIRLDQHPLSGLKNGGDIAICGHCKHRHNGATGTRSCYVVVAHGPGAIWRSWSQGRIRTVSPAGGAQFLAGLRVRLGSYGDPAAIDPDVWRTLLAPTSGRTGYTHQWTHASIQDLVMASVDTPAEQAAAAARGYRTFRVRSEGEPLLAGEITCPASDEAGHRTTCLQCGLCDGSRGPSDHRKNIAIIVHGQGARSFVTLQSLTS